VAHAVVSKPTGTSFLPEETVERCKIGSPIEKMKMAKDATSAWVDVYEYARKIREGEMTWEDVEKADLDNVSDDCIVYSFEYCKNLHLISTFSLFVAFEICWYAPQRQAYSWSIHVAPQGSQRYCKFGSNEILR
jgi:hypothetical protein